MIKIGVTKADKGYSCDVNIEEPTVFEFISLIVSAMEVWDECDEKLGVKISRRKKKRMIKSALKNGTISMISGKENKNE